jgi:hypothetical protein
MSKKEVPAPVLALTFVVVLLFVAVGGYLFLNQRPKQIPPPFAMPPVGSPPRVPGGARH